MSFTKESAVERAKADLASRLDLSETEIAASVADAEFSNMAMGASVDGELAAQMICNGWRLTLTAAGKDYEYRADRYNIRLVDFNGTNYIIES